MNAPQTLLGLIFWLLGGLALFLYGIDMMGKALRRAAGLALRQAFSSVTQTRLRGVAVGTLVTGLVQSSSATTVMIVGFINAGLLTFSQSISLILGANLGSTITPQVTALELDLYAVPLLGIGFLLSVLCKRRILRNLGLSIMGFGMLFFGLIVMKFAVSNYNDAIRGWLEGFVNAGFGAHLMAFFAAAAGTAIVQSSAVTVVMVQALAFQGALPNLTVAIPLILGAGVGTCITALLACVQASHSARRAAVAHLLFNVIGAGLAVLMMSFYLWLIPKTAADLPRQVANAHLLIRLVNVALFLPFATYFARFVEWIMPGEDRFNASPVYLDMTDIVKAPKALLNVEKEVIRLAKVCMQALSDAVNGFLERDTRLLDSVLDCEEKVDELCKAITYYTLRVSRGPMDEGLQDRPLLWLHIMSDVERIGDHAENVAQLVESYPEEETVLSEQAMRAVKDVASRVQLMGEHTLDVLDPDRDGDVAVVLEEKIALNEFVDRLLEQHANRVASGGSTPIGGIVYVEVIMNLRRVANHLRNIAVSAASGGPELSRLKQKLLPEDHQSA